MPALMTISQSCHMFKEHSLCSGVCPLPPLLSPGTNTKNLALSLWPFRSSVHIEDTALPLFFSRMSSPGCLSLSTCKRYCGPFTGTPQGGAAREQLPPLPSLAAHTAPAPVAAAPQSCARVRQQVSGGLRPSFPVPRGAEQG